MTPESLDPGDRVYVLARYANKIREKVVECVELNGVRLRGVAYPEPWPFVFPTREEAVDAMLERARCAVRKAEAELVAAKNRLRKLEQYAKAGV